jgi:pyruvate/2-oxoglutarate dehydrogenase complex dihydrolipoamide acyltransferase (E2) component
VRVQATLDDRTIRNHFDDGTLAAWLRRPEDVVAAGEAVAVVETADGALELVCHEWDGVLERLLVQGGDEIEAGAALAALRPLPRPAAVRELARAAS